MNIEKLYQDYSIDYPTEGKHFRDGWINCRCCWCDDSSYHLGYNTDENYFSCFRCGHHFVDDTIRMLLGVNMAEARKIMKAYGGNTLSIKEPKVIIRAKAFKLPSGTGDLQKQHRQYLEKRNFDVEKLEYLWDLKGTGPVSVLDDINYRHRIIIPFYWTDKIVSFDSRDITGKHRSKYMACPKERELVPHKSILYGYQQQWRDTGICVEGPADVWRLGTDAFAVSGIKYTQMQVRAMAKAFKRVIVIFDDEDQAQTQADKLVADLRFRKIEAFKIESIIAPDPGSMKQSDADYLVKQLIK